MSNSDDIVAIASCMLCCHTSWISEDLAPDCIGFIVFSGFISVLLWKGVRVGVGDFNSISYNSFLPLTILTLYSHDLHEQFKPSTDGFCGSLLVVSKVSGTEGFCLDKDSSYLSRLTSFRSYSS